MKSDHSFNLGDVAKCKITGFKGAIVAITNWLNGCVRITLQPEKLENGKPVEAITFDVEQLEIVKAGKHSVSQPSGGPCDDHRALSR